ncbi:8399_t:CDS:1, partial [Funneliformis geosporum]
LCKDLYMCIESLKHDLKEKKNSLKKFKRNANYQQKYTEGDHG